MPLEAWPPLGDPPRQPKGSPTALGEVPRAVHLECGKGQVGGASRRHLGFALGRVGTRGRGTSEARTVRRQRRQRTCSGVHDTCANAEAAVALKVPQGQLGDCDRRQ